MVLITCTLGFITILHTLCLFDIYDDDDDECYSLLSQRGRLLGVIFYMYWLIL